MVYPTVSTPEPPPESPKIITHNPRQVALIFSWREPKTETPILPPHIQPYLSAKGKLACIYADVRWETYLTRPEGTDKTFAYWGEDAATLDVERIAGALGLMTHPHAFFHGLHELAKREVIGDGGLTQPPIVIPDLADLCMAALQRVLVKMSPQTSPLDAAKATMAQLLAALEAAHEQARVTAAEMRTPGGRLYDCVPRSPIAPEQELLKRSVLPQEETPLAERPTPSSQPVIPLDAPASEMAGLAMAEILAYAAAHIKKTDKKSMRATAMAIGIPESNLRLHVKKGIEYGPSHPAYKHAAFIWEVIASKKGGDIQKRAKGGNSLLDAADKTQDSLIAEQEVDIEDAAQALVRLGTAVRAGEAGAKDKLSRLVETHSKDPDWSAIQARAKEIANG